MTYFADAGAKLTFPVAEGARSGFWPAQLSAAHSLSGHFFYRKEPAIVVMPTGSGKTAVMILACFLLRCRRALVLTPSRMVREQIAKEFATLEVLRKAGAIDGSFPVPKVIENDHRLTTAKSWKDLRKADVVVSTTQSASPVLDAVAEPPEDIFDLILCDEAHHTPAPTWRGLLDHFQSAHHALFTATPFRSDAKLIRGRVVFEYSLARARADGLFGELKYEPVDPAGKDPDVALALATQRKFETDKKAGHKHLVMVRTSLRSKAEKLDELYAKTTRLRLRTVFGSHSPKRLESVIADMKAEKLDGLICVDMLGEGFDLPNLKIAALHSPHRSLAVTLQFIGRFARTTGALTADATFLAVPSEFELEAKQLYVAGAEWNEIVEQASREKIETERETREVLAKFEEANSAESLLVDGDEIDLSTIAPYFHVKILEVPDGVDFTKPLGLPRSAEPLLLKRSDDPMAIVCVTKTSTQCRWSRDDRIANVGYDLFILYYDDASKLLFICSSQRQHSIYDELVNSVVKGVARRLTPEETNRVLLDIRNASFFSVGMRNRSAFGSGESYRMITGKGADRVIQKADGRFYDRGHVFGKGEESGTAITIGYSSASKVWANHRGNLAELFKWCRATAKKLVDSRTVDTHSGIDHLPLAFRAKGFPDLLIAGDWNEEVYLRENLMLRRGSVEHPLLEFEIVPGKVSKNKREAAFTVRGHGRSIDVKYNLSGDPMFKYLQQDDIAIHSADSDDTIDLLSFLREYPPSFVGSDYSRLEGDLVSPAPTNLDAAFPDELIDPVDWIAANIDPLCEKPAAPAGKYSLFEWLEKRLAATAASVIFNDDGSGEIADFVSLEAKGDGTTDAVLYHCKAAASLPVPGDRVDDLYEVTGQAVKSLRFTRSDLLLRHLERRLQTTKQGSKRIVRGDVASLRKLLAPGVPATFSIVVVQPGIGRGPAGPAANILAATSAYCVAGNCGPLRVIGTVKT